MQLGMIGLGKMGANMVRRLLANGHTCVVYDRDPARVDELAREGALPARSLDELVSRLVAPRAVWIMVPAGAPTEDAVRSVAGRLERGDTVIDGGNSHFKDDIRRALELAPRGIAYVDAGTSGGIWGRERGYCLMLGGELEAVSRLTPLWSALAPGSGDVPPARDRAPAGHGPGGQAGAPEAAPFASPTAERGYLHCGPAGAGHFVKMVHNGIEYGLMQAYAEGFDVLRHAGSSSLPKAERYELPLAEIAELWRRGSVVGSFLLDLTAAALAEDPSLARYSGFVEDSGEGRWTIAAALDEAVPAPVLSAALYARFRSRQSATFGDKLLSAMRHRFGGHVEPDAARASASGRAPSGGTVEGGPS